MSASVITHELKIVGNGSMEKGIEQIYEKGYKKGTVTTALYIFAIEALLVGSYQYIKSRKEKIKNDRELE